MSVVRSEDVTDVGSGGDSAAEHVHPSPHVSPAADGAAAQITRTASAGGSPARTQLDGAQSTAAQLNGGRLNGNSINGTERQPLDVNTTCKLALLLQLFIMVCS